MKILFNNIDEYNPKGIRKHLVVFDDMIADIMTNKSFQAIIKDLFRSRKLNMSLVFITPEEVRLNSTHYLIMEIHNKKELQNITINYSANIDYKVFTKI